MKIAALLIFPKALFNFYTSMYNSFEYRFRELLLSRGKYLTLMQQQAVQNVLSNIWLLISIIFSINVINI